MGSFTVAVVQLLRVLLKIMEKYTNSKSQFSCGCCAKCCQICLRCLSDYVKYLSRNAYVETGEFFKRPARRNKLFFCSRGLGYGLSIANASIFSLFLAMYGYSYCKAAKQAHKILVSNVLRVAAINSVGDFVLMLGKVLVVMATVSIAVEMLEVRYKRSDQIAIE